jgi:two-component system chemotaxis response regulator CheY
MLKCLVVDDSELDREIICHHLSGIAVCETAENGQQAVQMFMAAFAAGKPYDVVVLDIMMPVMDGNDAAKRMRDFEAEQGIRLGEGVHVIVTSALNTPQDIVKSYFNAVAAVHLIKPVKPAKLYKVLAKLELIHEVENIVV